MASVYSLGAALRTCHVCSAESPAREWVLADRVTVDRSTPGQQVLVRLDGIPLTDSRGRIAHVKAIYVHAQAGITINGATNPAISSYQLRSLWPSIFLRDITGWNFLSDIDARTILDHQYFAFGERLQQFPLQSGVQSLSPASASITADAGIAADAGAGDVAPDISFYLPLTLPGQNKMRGLIPLSSLQKVSNNAFTIRVGQVIKGANTTEMTYNGPQVTDLSGTRAGFDVWLEIVYLPSLVVDAAWELDNYTLSDLNGTLLNPSRKSIYSWLRYFPEDFAAEDAFDGQYLVGEYDGISLTAAGFSIMAGLDVGDVAQRESLHEYSRHSGAVQRGNAMQQLPLVDDIGITALCLLPYQDRHACAAGPVSFRYNTRGATADWSRYVHYTVECHTAARAAKIEASLGLRGCKPMGTNAKGSACSSVDGYEPVIAVPPGILKV